MGFKATAIGNGTDWSAIRDRVDLVRVATALMGPPPGRRGERSQRNRWWLCPFHQDQNPSLCIQAGRSGWKCFGCGEKGDALFLVMKLRGIGFPAAVEWLADFSGIVVGRSFSLRTKPPIPRVLSSSVPVDQPPASGLDLSQAGLLVEEASRQLWEPAGANWLAYLRNRGLTDETIRTAKLGCVNRLMVPKKDGSGEWSVSGVLIPWFDGDRLARSRSVGPMGRRRSTSRCSATTRSSMPDGARSGPGGRRSFARGSSTLSSSVRN